MVNGKDGELVYESYWKVLRALGYMRIILPERFKVKK